MRRATKSRCLNGLICAASCDCCIDHNGDRFIYSFMCILISLLGLIQVQRFYSITDTETRPRRLIKMHIKEYLNRSPLSKWSMLSQESWKVHTRSIFSKFLRQWTYKMVRFWSRSISSQFVFYQIYKTLGYRLVSLYLINHSCSFIKQDGWVGEKSSL